MTPEREKLVRATWAKFEPKAADHARFFYDKLFELDPESRTMFARANMNEQRHRLMETLGELVAELDDAERLINDLVVLGKRHLVYGVRDSDYDSAGVALLWTLEQALGPRVHAGGAGGVDRGVPRDCVRDASRDHGRDRNAQGGCHPERAKRVEGSSVKYSWPGPATMTAQ
jgi:hemoglobin-like flavoprotein